MSARPSQNRPPCGTRLAAARRGVARGLLRARRVLAAAPPAAAQADALVLLVVRADAEIRLPVQIHQRRHRAHALARAGAGPPSIAGSVAGRAIGMRRAVAGGAGQPARRRQRWDRRKSAGPSRAIADSGAAGGRTQAHRMRVLARASSARRRPRQPSGAAGRRRCRRRRCQHADSRRRQPPDGAPHPPRRSPIAGARQRQLAGAPGRGTAAGCLPPAREVEHVHDRAGAWRRTSRRRGARRAASCPR